MRRRPIALCLVIGAALVFVAAASAGNGGFAPETPHSPNASRINDSYKLIALFTGLILILVEVALITFVSIAAAVFFFVVKPVNMLMARRKTEPPVDETVRPCPECLSEIPSAARRCAFCTAQLAPAT